MRQRLAPPGQCIEQVAVGRIIMHKWLSCKVPAESRMKKGYSNESLLLVIAESHFRIIPAALPASILNGRNFLPFNGLLCCKEFYWHINPYPFRSQKAFLRTTHELQVYVPHRIAENAVLVASRRTKVREVGGGDRLKPPRSH